MSNETILKRIDSDANNGDKIHGGGIRVQKTTNAGKREFLDVIVMNQNQIILAFAQFGHMSEVSINTTVGRDLRND